MAYPLLVALMHTASAQEAPPTAKSETEDKEATVVLNTFVVTGTILRGIEPVGTNVVGLSRDKIEVSGAMDSNMLLSQVPQISSAFNQAPALPARDPGNSIIRPQLRNFGNTSGATTTLVLIDGHRSVSAGVLITAPDPGVIPPGILERIDVVPDGGSSIYGSDAVAGIINYITRKRFDGTQLDTRYGVANKYFQWDANLTTGKDWGKGGAYLSYSYAKHDSLVGRDLGWFRQADASEGYVSQGTVYVNGTSYALPDRVPGTIAQGDNLAGTPFMPAEQRHSIYAVLNQELSDSVEVDVRAFYSKREVDLNNDTAASNISGDITSANPFYVPIGANDPGVQTVRFNYGVVERDHSHDQYGIVGTINVDLNDNWQLSTLLNYGRSTVELVQPTVDNATQASALASSDGNLALNPYNVSATANVVRGIFYDSLDRGDQSLANARIILEGTPFSMAGGDVRTAIGSEYSKETADITIQTSRVDSTTRTPSRNVKSFFGEVAFPLVGRQNAKPGIAGLTVSASGRRDDYSDWGSTTNPKIGLTYKPTEWATLRANAGKSFNAPSMADTRGATDSRIILFNTSPFVDASDTINTNRPSAIIVGGNPTLQPQKAKTWSVGFDLNPPSMNGLKVSATYYNIKMTNEIGNMFASVFIPLGTQALFRPEYSAYTTKTPSQALIESLASGLPIVNAGHASINSFFNDPDGAPYALLDWRRQNLGIVEQDGIDFNVSKNFKTDFGSITANLGGTYILNRDKAAAVGQALTDQLASPGMSRLSLAASLSTTYKKISASATVRQNGGYDLQPVVGGLGSVGSFTTVDLFVSYDLRGSGWSKDLELTLSLGNVFDETPPRYNAAQGYANGSTLGRLFQVGVSKKF